MAMHLDIYVFNIHRMYSHCALGITVLQRTITFGRCNQNQQETIAATTIPQVPICKCLVRGALEDSAADGDAPSVTVDGFLVLPLEILRDWVLLGWCSYALVSCLNSATVLPAPCWNSAPLPHSKLRSRNNSGFGRFIRSLNGRRKQWRH